MESSIASLLHGILVQLRNNPSFSGKDTEVRADPEQKSQKAAAPLAPGACRGDYFVIASCRCG